MLEKKVSLVCTDLELQSALKQLQQNYGVNFSYANNLIPLQQKVTVRVKDQPLKVALDELFRDLSVGYTVVGNQVVLRRDKPQAPEEKTGEPAAKPFPKQNQENGAKKTAPQPSGTAPAPAKAAPARNTPVTAPASGKKQAAATETKADQAQVKGQQPASEAPGEATAAATNTPAAAIAAQHPALPSDAPVTSSEETTVANAANPAAHPAAGTSSDTVAMTASATSANASATDTAATTTTAPAPALAAKTDTAADARTGLAAALAPVTEPETYRKFFNSLQDSFSRLSEKAGRTFSPSDTTAAARDKAVREPLRFQASDTAGTGIRQLVARVMQEDSTETVYPVRPFQFTLITPIGTNGIDSWNVANNFSFNLLAGYAAGLKGLEVGGLLNAERDYMKGAQAAGFVNLVGRRVTGVQVAGFGNLAGGFTRGLQYSGFANLIADSAYALQFAGFANLVTGNLKGGQFSGFANLSAGSMYGMQASGFGNIAAGKVTGGQLAGFANIAADTTEGLQISGFVNIARYVKGFQLGVLNVADTVEGLPIGFLSIVRRGRYSSFEVFAGEGWYGNVAYKIGVKRFYNIFTLGANYGKNRLNWGYGYGIGTLFPSEGANSVSLDLLSYNVHDGVRRRSNQLYQLRLLFNKQLTGDARFFAGPSVNVQVVRRINSFGAPQPATHLAPFTVFDFTRRDNRIFIWPGLQVGIGF